MSAESQGRRTREAERATIRDVLAVREYRGMVLSQVASQAGDQVARVALALLVLSHTDSPLLAAATFAISFVPTLLGGAILGPLADRYPRRTVMLVADLGRAVLVALIALAAVPGMPLWLLFLLLLVAEMLTPLFDSARAATTPAVLGTVPLVVVGSSLTSALSLVNQAIGLVLGGLVVQLIGSRGALGLDALSFLVSFALLAGYVQRRPAAREASSPSLGALLGDLRRGWALLMADSPRRSLVLLGWGMAVPVVGPEAVGLAYARDQGLADGWGGLLMAVVVTGAAVGALLVGRRTGREQLDLVLPLAMLMCLPLLVTGVEPPPPVLVVLWFLAGVAQAFLLPVMNFTTLLTPNEQRGMVVGLAAAGFSLVTAVGYLLVGWVAGLTSPAFAVVVTSVLGLVVASAAYVVWPASSLRAGVRRLEEHGV